MVSLTEYTPAPWFVAEVTQVRLDAAYLVRPVNDANYTYGAALAVTSKNDAIRVTAAINATKGIPTDELIQASLKVEDILRNRRVKVTRQMIDAAALVEEDGYEAMFMAMLGAYRE